MKTIVTKVVYIVLFSNVSFSVFAQDGNAPIDAIPITLTNAENSVVLDLTRGSAIDYQGNPKPDARNRNRWFKFTANETFIKLYSTTNSRVWDIQLYKNTTPGATSPTLESGYGKENASTYNAARSKLIFRRNDLIVGQEYYVEVSTVYAVPTIDLFYTSKIDHDYPEGAKSLNEILGEEIKLRYYSYVDASGNYINSDNKNIWLKFRMPDDKSYIKMYSDKRLRLWRVRVYNSDRTTLIDSDQTSNYNGSGWWNIIFRSTNLTPGEEYYAEIYLDREVTTDSPFMLNYSFDYDNDFPQGATNLGELVESQQTIDAKLLSYSAPNGDLVNALDKNIWYSFTAGTSGFIKIETNNGIRLWQIKLYENRSNSTTLPLELNLIQEESGLNYRGSGITNMIFRSNGLEENKEYFVEVYIARHPQKLVPPPFELTFSTQIDNNYPSGATIIPHQDGFVTQNLSNFYFNTTTIEGNDIDWTGDNHIDNPNMFFKLKAFNEKILIDFIPGTISHYNLRLYEEIDGVINPIPVATNECLGCNELEYDDLSISSKAFYYLEVQSATSNKGTFSFRINGGYFSHWSQVNESDLYYDKGDVTIGHPSDDYSGTNNFEVKGTSSAQAFSLKDHLTIKSYEDGNIHFVTNGFVGIGPEEMDFSGNTNGYKLVVPGKIGSHGVKIENTSAILNMPDYVFEKDYELKPISEVESFVEEHKHLPGVPSASEFREEGLEVDEMISKLLEKIEELTLYVIQLKKENQSQQQEIEALRRK